MTQNKFFSTAYEIDNDDVFYNCTFHGINFDFWEGVTFYSCVFRNCDLEGVDGSIIRCTMYDCKVYGCNVDVYDTVFHDCEFDSHDAYFYCCNFNSCKGQQVAQACPSHGEFIAWKAAIAEDTNLPCIVKLLIPADADRSSAGNNKCRASKAVVLEIQDATTTEKPLSSQHAYSYWDEEFKYEPGMTVYPTSGFNYNRWNECAAGIHFFVDREGALQYAEGIEY